MPITSSTLFALAAKSETYHRTVQSWLNPEKRSRMKPSVRARIDRAAAELGITAPQPIAMARPARQLA
jgi:DNA-binding LacI/PurR family transcriptional regulator